MNIATKCYLALGIDKRPVIVRIAACVLSRYIFEMHRYGEFAVATKGITKLAKRFGLGDYAIALHAHYPPRGSKQYEENQNQLRRKSSQEPEVSRTTQTIPCA